MMNTENPGPDLRLAKGDPEVTQVYRCSDGKINGNYLKLGKLVIGIRM
jgi:hypothetical protein